MDQPLQVTVEYQVEVRIRLLRRLIVAKMHVEVENFSNK
jgi:hypothetical protein